MKYKIILEMGLLALACLLLFFICFAGEVGTSDKRNVRIGFHPQEPTLEYMKLCDEIAGKKSDTVLLWVKHDESCSDFCNKINLFSDEGYEVIVTWELWDGVYGINERNGTCTLKRVADGYYDADIERWARCLKENKRPVILRPFHEFNGFWYPWCIYTNGNSPEDFNPAWRHFVDVFREEGANNVQFALSSNVVPPGMEWTDRPELPYPGDDYVDIIGLSGYNRPPSEYNSWMSFDEIFKKSYEELINLSDKPVWIFEFASTGRGGDKAAWIADSFEKIKNEYPGIEGVIWFQETKMEEEGIGDWSIITVEEIRAFREGVKEVS